MFGSRKRNKVLEQRAVWHVQERKQLAARIERLENSKEDLVAAKTRLYGKIDKLEEEANERAVQLDTKLLDLKIRTYRAEGYEWEMEDGEIAVVSPEGVVLDTISVRGTGGLLTPKGVRSKVVQIIERSQA